MAMRLRANSGEAKGLQRAVFLPSTVLDSPSLLNQLDIAQMEMPKGSAVDARSMKLKQGVEATMYCQYGDERSNDEIDMGGALSSTNVLEKPADLLIKLRAADLVAVKPTANGWFAELILGPEEKAVVDAFCNSIWAHFKKDHPELAFVSPLSDPLAHEKRDGAAAKMQAKVRRASPLHVP